MDGTTELVKPCVRKSGQPIEPGVSHGERGQPVELGVSCGQHEHRGQYGQPWTARMTVSFPPCWLKS